MNELIGTTIYDRSGNGLNGVYTGVDLGQNGIGDGRPCPYFDGTNDVANIYSAGLAAAVDGAEGTLMAWARVSSSGVWTDGITRRIVNISRDGGLRDRVAIAKYNAADQVSTLYNDGGSTRSLPHNVTPDLNWFHIAIVWSAAEIRGFYNGASYTYNSTGATNWTTEPGPTYCTIGAWDTTPTNVFTGDIAHVALWDRALTPAEIAELAVV
jgi:hypothetical protein